MKANVPWIIGPLFDLKYILTHWESPVGDTTFPVPVRYFFLFPYFAKLSLPLHIEYLKVIDVAAGIVIYIGYDLIRAERKSLSAQPKAAA